MNSRAFSTSSWTCQEIGGTCEYHGQTVSWEWQSRQALARIERTGPGASKPAGQVWTAAVRGLTSFDHPLADINTTPEITANPSKPRVQGAIFEVITLV